MKVEKKVKMVGMAVKKIKTEVAEKKIKTEVAEVPHQPNAMLFN
jgi:hypothetical protein